MALAPRSLHAVARRPVESTRRILYVLAQFSQATPEAMRAVVETIGASSFNVVVLSFLQATWNNDKLALRYNGNDVRRLSPELPALLHRLRSGFSVPKRLMLSIGGWQQLSTFAAIRSCGVSAFVRQLSKQVIEPLGLAGIDLDLEPQTGGMDQWINVYREYGKLLVDLTNEYKRIHPDHLVTHAPLFGVAAELYATPTLLSGLPQGLLAGTRTSQGNNVDWINVQLYAGNMPIAEDIGSFYRKSLMTPMLAHRAATGVQNPLHFCVPLFQPQARQSLGVCVQSLRRIEDACADLHLGNAGSVALWEYAQIADEMEKWSRGLVMAVLERRNADESK